MLATGYNRLYLIVAVLAVAALVAVAWVALAGAQEQDPVMVESGGNGMEKLAGRHTGSGSATSYDGPSGIWVSGTGKASSSPDIAVVSLGVESQEPTAAEARTNAANAMRGVMSALITAGVSIDDIQTRHFNISPRYQSVEIERCESDEDDDNGSDNGNGEEETEETEKTSCVKVWESRLIGYSVSNQAVVKVRNQTRVGAIIDAVAAAAGDLVRINGVSFDIEDPQSLQDEARTAAVADLLRKAQMLADLSGVELGRLVYLSEGEAYTPPQPLYARAQVAFADAASEATIISGGELEFSVTVQGVFLIAEKPAMQESAEPAPTEPPPTAPASTTEANGESGSQ